jgi:hypothetical protein
MASGKGKNKMKKLEKIISRIFDVAVISGVGTGLAGAIADKPIVMYSAIAGTFLTVIAGAHYYDTKEQRERKYLL